MSKKYAIAYIDDPYAFAYLSFMTEQIVRNEQQLGAALRRVRRKRGQSQSALGERVHLRQATISRVEAGEPAVQLSTIMSVLAALDLELVVRPRSKTDVHDIDALIRDLV